MSGQSAADAQHAGTLTRGPLLARNVGINVLGWVLPAIAALIAVPLLVRGLGDARFGLLALCWTTLGYFGLFDLGLGRAVTHAVSDRIGGARDGEVAGVVWSALAVLVPLGVAGGLVLVILAPWLATGILNVPPELQREALTAFRLLAVAVPFVGGAAVLRGVLEARQRFGLVNAIRVPYGVLLFLGPAAALPFTRSLVPAIAILVAVRVALFVALFAATSRTTTGFLGARGDVSRASVAALVGYGGWMTVSNVISPLMNTFDQFVIGAVLTVGMVTYYASPSELVTKLWLFTAAIYPVFFAALASTGLRDPGRSALLFDRMLRATFAAMFLPALVFVALAPEILGAWLGPAFTGDSARVLQILAIAVFVNTLGQGGLNFIQAFGRPDLTGKYHLAELPVYVVALWFLLGKYGIVGAAIAWAIRAVGDAFLLLLTCPVLLRETRAAAVRTVLWCVGAAVLLSGLMWLPTTMTRIVVVALAMPLWLAVTWFLLLTPQERALVAPAPGAAAGRTPPGPLDPPR